MPHAFIAAQFKQLGLDTYTHNFSVQYPLDENEVTRLSCWFYRALLILKFLKTRFIQEKMFMGF